MLSQYRFLKPEPDSRTEAFLHAISVSLNPGETPVIPPSEDTLSESSLIAMILFGVGSVVATFFMGLAIFARDTLNRCRHRKFDAHENSVFDFLFKYLTVMLPVPLAFLVCGFSARLWYINSSVAYALAAVGAGLYILTVVGMLSM